jgi:Ca-activated chloride channel family protein
MLLLLAQTVGVALAQDQQTYTVKITQVDTSQFPVINVWVQVTDAAGNPVSVVPDADFTLLEAGQPVEITEVFQAGEQGAVSTVLVIDRSGSMVDPDPSKLPAAKAAAKTFVELMRPEDTAAVIAFNTQVDVLQPLTSDKAALNSAIDSIEAFSDTAMYDALSTSIETLGPVQGRRVVIVLSDGLDNRSQQTADSILGSIQGAEMSIYAIGLGNPAVGSNAGIDEDALRAIAEKTNGEYRFTPSPEDLTALYQNISLQLQNEYRLTYTSPNALRDGFERGLVVQVSRSASEQTGYNPGGVIPETATALSWPVFGAILAGLVVLLAIPLLLGAFRGGGAKSAGKKSSRVKLKGDTTAAGRPAAGTAPKRTASNLEPSDTLPKKAAGGGPKTATTSRPRPRIRGK